MQAQRKLQRGSVGLQAQSEEEAILMRYFDDISDSQPLSRREEEELAARIEEGDMGARDALVQANLRFVIDVARNYQNRGLPLSELISAGNLGLITAAERFDGQRGYKFISYAVWWIRQAILQAIAEDARTVRLPLNQLTLIREISRISRQLGQGRETDPDVEEIASEMELSSEQVRNAMLRSRPLRSLDEALEEGGDRTLLSVLPDERQPTTDAHTLNRAAREQVEGVLEHLSERERYIVRLYYGLDGEDTMTLEEIGRVMKLTRERVRQLKERALRKLRSPDCQAALMALMETNEVY